MENDSLCEIFAVPFFGQGHMLPFMELCAKFCSMQHKVTLILSSDLISTVPASLLHHDLFTLSEVPLSLPPLSPKSLENLPPGPSPLIVFFQQLGEHIESLISRHQIQNPNPNPTRRVFALVDDLMLFTKDIFTKSGIPVAVFSAFAAVATALSHAAWKNDVETLLPGETRVLPGLPDYMAFQYSDLTIRRNNLNNPFKPKWNTGPDGLIEPPTVAKQRTLPTEPGDEPHWVEAAKGSVAFLINSCDELEHPFLNYISTQTGIPTWGVGPLLPEESWKRNDLDFKDSKLRPNRKSNYTEDQVIQWLDSKPRRSVIYVTFGSQTAPKWEEQQEIAKALEEIDRPFIWVIQTGPDVEIDYYPNGLEGKVGNKGLIIHGWAPQLLIFSHPSIGGCLTHSGWSSTLEAIPRGIPILAWPLRGDQYYNAISIERHLKIGYIISDRDDESEIITKDAIIKGINNLMDDEDIHKQVEDLGVKVFKDGFAASSLGALNFFFALINRVAKRY